jgi:cation diffusion facilitator family transporter
MSEKPHNHARFTHGHRFLGHDHERAEARARAVAILTAAFMVCEIAAGLIFGSMALLADGVHMATHAGAIGLAALAYWLARRNEGNARFSFGAGKFGDLAAFASAVVLGMLAVGVAIQSVERILAPGTVAYGEALIVAAIGLGINLLSAALLHDGHHHGHDHDDDHNLRAAYVHVLADALTSILAMAALAAGLYFGVAWADPLAGLIGAVVIASWSYGLIRDSALVLLDAAENPALAVDIRSWVEQNYAVAVYDFHLWRLGPGHLGLILSLVGGSDTDIEKIKERLAARFPNLSHITVEAAVCADCAPDGRRPK